MKALVCKIYFIKFLLHIPLLRKWGWQMYAKLLGGLISDSINNAEEVKKLDLPLYGLCLEIKALSYMMALLPATTIIYYVGQLTNKPDWFVNHIKRAEASK